tara:strand:+ start:7661 stop:8029 length:369 start_codon:yes stop_codon:yes gene_type:complete
MTEPILNDNWISINLNELVKCRNDNVVKVELEEDEIDEIASDLRRLLTWDTLYGMVDNAILEYVGELETHYGEIQPEPGREKELMRLEKEAKERKKYFEENFDLVDLVAPAWTIQVPMRKDR